MGSFLHALAWHFDFDGVQFYVIGLAAVVAFLASAGRRSSRRCPKCREVNRQEAFYCAQCGTRLPDP